MRKWRIAICVLALLGTGGGRLPAAAADASIIQIAGRETLQRQFCEADTRTEHILVLPAALFVDGRELLCPAGPYKLYRIVGHADPDDFVYFIDPPFGSTGRLACDGKAGRSMQMIAVNCRPV